jgi:hypothetical protein
MCTFSYANELKITKLRYFLKYIANTLKNKHAEVISTQNAEFFLYLIFTDLHIYS